MLRASFTAKASAAFLLAACSSDHCLAAACPIGPAFTLTVTSSASGAPVSGISVTGDPFDGQCNDPVGTCTMWGYAGKYTVTIEAPGFQSVQRMITVQDDGASCCSLAVPGHLDVTLVPLT